MIGENYAYKRLNIDYPLGLSNQPIEHYIGIGIRRPRSVIIALGFRCL